MTGRICRREAADLEPAVDEAEQVGELGRGGEQHVVRVFAVGDERAEALDRCEVLALLRHQRPRPAAPQRELADDQPDDEEEDGGLDVVARVDPQREVRLGVEQVEADGRGHGGQHAGGPAPGGREAHDGDHEEQGDVGRRPVVAQRDQSRGGCERDRDRPEVIQWSRDSREHAFRCTATTDDRACQGGVKTSPASHQGSVKALRFRPHADGVRTTPPCEISSSSTVTVGFFALAALVVAACDRIVGPDPADLTVGDRSTPTDTELVAR